MGVDNREGINGHRADTADIIALRRMVRGLRRLYEQELRAITVLVGLGGRDLQSALTDIQIDKLRGGLALVTDGALRDRVKELDIALARLSRSAMDVTKSHEALVGSLDEAQLQAVMRTEFLRAAHTFTADEWAHLDRVRAVQAKEGIRAATIANRNGLRGIGHRISTSPGMVPEFQADDMEDDDE